MTEIVPQTSEAASAKVEEVGVEVVGLVGYADSLSWGIFKDLFRTDCLGTFRPPEVALGGIGVV